MAACKKVSRRGLTLRLSRPPLTSMDGNQEWPDDIDTASTFPDESDRRVAEPAALEGSVLNTSARLARSVKSGSGRVASPHEPIC